MWIKVCVLGSFLVHALAVKHFTYKILERIDHRRDFFTQGLLFRLSDGALVEGTGLYKSSVLALYEMTEDTKSPVKTKLVKSLPAKHFGEGIAELQGRLYQGTWKERKVHVWNSTTLEPIEVRTTPEAIVEGWGIATTPSHDGLIMTDGSAKLVFVSPDSIKNGGFTKDSEVVAVDCEHEKLVPLGGLNELEVVPLRMTHPEELPRIHNYREASNFEEVKAKPTPPGALVWSNIVATRCIAMIHPISGHVKGYLHIDGLDKDVIHTFDEVANGIAYRDSDESIWVTGKHWKELYRIELVQLENPPRSFPNKCKTPWRGLHTRMQTHDQLCKSPDGRTEL